MCIPQITYIVSGTCRIAKLSSVKSQAAAIAAADGTPNCRTVQNIAGMAKIPATAVNCLMGTYTASSPENTSFNSKGVGECVCLELEREKEREGSN